MPHLSRMLAAICAITVILFSLSTDARIGDKELPLVNGEKAKLLYTVVGVTDLANLATVFHCTSTERTGGKRIDLGIEIFYSDGGSANDVTAGDGWLWLLPGETRTLATRSTIAFTEHGTITTGDVNQGSARIFATSKNLLCSAMVVDPDNTPPTSMVMLPVFRATKQGGM